MDPNQQPNQPNPNQPQVPPPAPGQQPAPTEQPQPTPQVQQPVPAPAEQPLTWSQPAANPTSNSQNYPQTPSAYASAAQPGYDPNYLDSIAPPPPPPKFFSGAFGKIFFGLIGVFVMVVSIIIAFSGQDQTADLQQMVVRLENMANTAKTVQKSIRSSNLSNTNTVFQVWITGNRSQGEELLKTGGVKRTDYSKKMVADEKQLATDLDAKFEDARLGARLNRVYASTMASETEKMINMLNVMSKKSKSPQIRDYAKTASNNLKQIQKDFNEYVDDGN